MQAAAFLEDHSGEAADTGSAVHKAVAFYHGGDVRADVEAALAAMGEARESEFPLADLSAAEKHFRAYCLDPRNQTAEVVAVEMPIALQIDPAPEDPTQAPIEVVGTLDQIRRDFAGRLKVWDVKTSSRPGYAVLHSHTYQLAAYVRGAAAVLRQAVDPGGFILTKAYLKRGVDPASEPDGVFAEVPWTEADVDRILDGVRAIVARIRAGDVWIGPGDHCQWCPAQGVASCLPKLISLSA